MVNVSKEDIDAGCAAYRRATGDKPRREGIRVALHSYRQLTDDERTQLAATCDVLVDKGFSSAAELVRKIAGLPDAF